MVPDPDELGRLLIQRRRCLGALVVSPCTKRELVDTIEIPRSTLDGIMRDLDDSNLVAYDSGEWYATLLGRCAYNLHDEYRAQLASLAEVASLGDAFQPDSPVADEFLLGADIHEAETTVPDEVFHVMLESVSDGSRVRFFTPSVIAAYVDPFYRRASTGEDARVELIIPRDLFDRLQKSHSDLLDEILHDPCVSFLHTSIPVSFGLWIVDDAQVGILIYTDCGIKGILVNDTADALEWANDLYERVKRGATPHRSRTCRPSRA